MESAANMEETNRPDHAQLTHFLNELAGGRTDAAEDLMPYVHAQLRSLAGACLGGQRAEHTLQPTALVHEAFLKLFVPKGNEGTAWSDRKHFFALAARAMRQVLVDHARAQRRLKRGGDHLRVTLDGAVAPGSGPEFELLDLDDALEELSRRDERQARIVELRFFGGLEVTEVAELLGISNSTIEREWRAARAWLGVRLAGHRGTES